MQNGSAIIEDWQKKAQVARMKAWNEKEVLPVQTAAGITKTMAPRDEITLDMYEVDRPVSDVHDFTAISAPCLIKKQSLPLSTARFAALCRLWRRRLNRPIKSSALRLIFNA